MSSQRLALLSNIMPLNTPLLKKVRLRAFALKVNVRGVARNPSGETGNGPRGLASGLGRPSSFVTLLGKIVAEAYEG